MHGESGKKMYVTVNIVGICDDFNIYADMLEGRQVVWACTLNTKPWKLVANGGSICSQYDILTLS